MENGAGIKLFFWTGTAIILLSVFGIILMVLIYRNKLYLMKKKESETLLKVSLETEKKERKRIASDLHDCVNGDISAMKNYLGLLLRKETDDFKKDIILELDKTLGKTLSNIENISYNLMPPTLHFLGLISTLKGYFERVRKWNSIIIDEDYYSENISVSSSVSYELFRVIQELTTNMIKHGKATRINFAVLKKKNTLIFEVSDNGTSFDFQKSLSNPYGMGLKNIISRIKHINAQLTQIKTDKGNTIEIHLKV